MVEELFNTTTLKEASNLIDITMYANTAAQGLLFTMLIFAIFFVLLLGLKNYGAERSIAASSFACLVLSLMLKMAGVIELWIPLFFLATAGTVMGIMYYKSR